MAARSAEKNCKAFDRRKGCYSDCYKGLQREMAARSAGKKSKAFYKGESRYKAFFLRELAARSAEIFEKVLCSPLVKAVVEAILKSSKTVVD